MPEKSVPQILRGAWVKIRSLEKVRLFSLVALICILFFYSIPSSKRSVYLMPAYPFIALFLSEYVIYITEYRTKVTRVFAAFLASIVLVVMIALALVMAGVVDPLHIASSYTDRANTLNQVEWAVALLKEPNTLTLLIYLLVGVALVTVVYQMFKKINIKILYATIALTFCVNLLIDGVVMRGVRTGSSARPFAERIRREYPIDSDNIFVMNNLKIYRNLYGLNFYLGNIFHNFEKVQPAEGYFLCAEGDLPKVLANYGDRYAFETLTKSDRPDGEVKQPVLLCSFARK